MADHFIALNRGASGFTQNDFTTGVGSSASAPFELRIKDGAGLTKKDAHLALKALEMFFENSPWVVSAGVDVAL